ncbi:MAG: bifunctional UDP-N-acetylglucosamine diphosphorylase/glucosamine-1-phosphate N-acetyltransferase GlmU [Clostridia bacterium]|nr:bifunctional UDP-N-acetylglucosamine diphosphorylase/glucosamine-1-phosphate N-acetyltransferase GlmU [Clostridia bacterium]
MIKNCAVILAAGEGTRMKSKLPKAMAEVLFKPMIDWVTDCLIESGIEDICVVTGHLGNVLVDHLGGKFETVQQPQRLGTGHAVYQAKEFIEKHSGSNVLVLNGDAPFIDSNTVRNALSYHEENGFAATVITAEIDNPFGYGRIVRDESGDLLKIVEQKEADEKEKAIKEVNSGAYWFRSEKVLIALDTLIKIREQSEDGKEYYLTDAIEILKLSNDRVGAFVADSGEIVLGANDRAQLAQLNEIAREKELNKHLSNGVSIPFTNEVVICPGVEIGSETVILQSTTLKPGTKIGSNCEIGPNSVISNCTVGDGTLVQNSYCYDSKIGNNAEIGPFVRIRPNCTVGDNTRVGNFVELKNSVIGNETKVSHLTYVGDSDVGEDVNFGCGCATVNFDGRNKHRSVIGDGSFIGCGTNIVSPVRIGKDAYVAAGSTIVEDVPENALAIARNRQVNKHEWVIRKKPYRRMK